MVVVARAQRVGTTNGTEREGESDIGEKKHPGGTSGTSDEPERCYRQRNIFTISLIAKCDRLDGDVDQYKQL